MWLKIIICFWITSLSNTTGVVFLQEVPEVCGIQWAADEEAHPQVWEAQEGAQEKAFQRQLGTQSAEQF